ncbi:MAG: hypothetical protein AAB532_04080 [Patescibacteria group bacterium]
MPKHKLSKDQILKIKKMRSNGNSIPEISNKLQIPRTTVFYHSVGVKILPEFIDLWKSKRAGSRYRKIIQEKSAIEDAKIFVKKLSDKERILFASALYWGEGNKKDFIISNSDPDLINLFLKILINNFQITKERISVSIRIFEDMDKDKCLDFWSKVVDIPKENFLNVYILKGKKKGKLEYGMCRVRVSKGGSLLKRIKAINKMVFQAIASID